ncbi:MAG: FtsW/RodA/SpoVE family cell cycle protein [Sedimentisphaerales bacterium]|nr:FtsW/RodA/SpoVE family cell cycle protein [Sedimentisphaerales bacterium]
MLVAAGLLVCIGLATLYAIGHPAEGGPAAKDNALARLYSRQLAFAILGTIMLISVNAISYRTIGRYSGWIFALVIGLLIILALARVLGRVGIHLPFVPYRNNVYQWITLGIGRYSIGTIQPSEFCKLAYILFLSWHLRYRSNYRRFKVLIGPFILTIIPVCLILVEPDLGTACLLIAMLLAMLFVAGARAKHLGMIICLGLALSPLVWQVLSPTHKGRITAVLLQNQQVRKAVQESPLLSRILVGGSFDPTRWERAEGYQLERSKHAVASGGLTGYGFRKGPFIKYDFLVYRESDFIFSVIAHQWGLVGALGVLGLYGVIVLSGLEIATNNTDPFGRLLAVGIVIMLTLEVLVNVSVTIGLMPVTGLTLPLISHGGSSLLVHMIAIGLLNNIGRSRPFTLARKT